MSEVEIPEAFRELFLPGWRDFAAYGGRGGTKSHSIASALVLMVAERGLRVVCAREIQDSIRDSVKQLIEDKITAFGLDAVFEKQVVETKCLRGGGFIYKGVWRNPASIKSLEGADIFWGEEANRFSAQSIRLIRPTLRKPGSRMIWSWNPESADDPVDKMFRGEAGPPPPSPEYPLGTIARAVSWRDNKWFNQSPLRAEMENDYRTDPEIAAHVWAGEYATVSDAQVLRGRYRVEAFEPDQNWDGPYFGADWGFSVDPTALVKVWVDGRTLYVESEAYGVGVAIDDTPALFGTISGSADYVVRADNARPETINYLQRHGFPRLVAADKWPGSVEDGVEHLRSYERIVIHPRCVNAAREARLWRYQTDRLTGDVLPKLQAGNDHTIDAVRYALSPLIRKRSAAVIAPLRI